MRGTGFRKQMKINEDFSRAGKMYRRSSLLIPSLFKAKIEIQKLNPVRLQSAVHAVNLNVSPNRYSEELLNGLLRGDRASLASAITLVESRHPRKIQNAQWLLSQVLNEAKKKYEKFGDSSLSFRIGLTGPPGAGKSTFIETFGKLLTSKGHKVAVLTVDPSSSTSGGSLLGDKTRMPELSRDVNAYIRPSPTSGCLGGVTRSTNEAIAMCECAGYDTIIVETVGVGQSEIDVCRMVDMFVLIVPPAGGDELQALKKGVVELADIVAVNKADGNFLPSARRIKAEFVSALKFIKQRHRLWKATVMLMSCLQKEGIEEVWNKMTDYRKIMLESGELQHRRKQQYVTWMWSHIENRLLSEFKSHNKIKDVVKDVESQVWEGSITPGQASDYLIGMFFGK